jgi:hypothetical protein
VVVQPLSREQVDAHQVTQGKPLAALRTALKKNATLQTLATTPLMLQVLMRTYHNTSIRALTRDAAHLQAQIWADYVQRMITDKGNVKRYPLDVSCVWLSWLAWQMQDHNQKIFFLEQFQPDPAPDW